MNDAKITEPFLLKLKARIESDPDITVSGLAIKAGLGNSAIRLMFSRNVQSLRISTARQICAALGTTLEEFMSEAHTPEEQEIVRLVSQLPDHLRRQLLGYGQGLLVSKDQAAPKSGEDEQ
ncbi:MAG: hypothetical protein COA53_06535 [Rhodobacteraceae bacterium]|nr:MAG: hypothetical protein COA53_06535 [Paracoccaceae bacterium]